MSARKAGTAKMPKWKKAAIGLGATAAIALGFGQATGALYSDTETGSVTITTGSLTAALSDDNATAGLDLSFAIAPGVPQEQAMYVTNNGTVQASVVMSAPPATVFVTPASGSNPDINMLMFGVDGYAAYQQVAGSAAVDLGVIMPGQTIRYVLKVGLSDTAGNEWQGATIAATLEFVLTQQL